MVTTSLSGTGTTTLLDRLNSWDGVGAGLAVRTRDEYAKKITTISNHIRADEGGALTPRSLSDFLTTSFASGRIAQATGRSQKAAALYWLADKAEPLLARGADISEFEVAYERIQSLPTAQLPKKTGATSSTKLKFFSKQALDALTEYTETSTKALSAGTLLAFVRANLLVGLRPAEWFNATFISYLMQTPPRPLGYDLGELEDTRSDPALRGDYLLDSDGRTKSVIALRIANAKQTQGRANGATREILLHDITADELATLKHFLEIVRRFAAKYPPDTETSEMAKDLFKPLQQTLRNALRRKIPDHRSLPTVYSTRHQAVANCKLSGMSDREVAAFFGHGSVSTAKQHYGKKINGWSKTTFRPSPESVAAVKERTPVATNAEPSPDTRREAEAWLNHDL